MKRRLKAKDAKMMADKTCWYPLITYNEVERYIREAARKGRTWLSIKNVNLSKKTVNQLKWNGFHVYDRRAAANIQAGNGLDLDGHWFITW